MDEVKELPLPKDFPSDPALGAVWAARSLVDTIGMMLVLNRGAKFPPDDVAVAVEDEFAPEDFGRVQLRPLLSRFNRDLRELQARLPAINKLAAALHGMTGVRVADRQGTCYADIAESLGRSLQTAILVATNPAGLVQLNAGIFVPIDPDKAVAGWRQITVWFDEQSQASLEQLEIALFNEHVAVNKLIASAEAPDKKLDGKEPHVNGHALQLVTYGMIAGFIKCHPKTVARWARKHSAWPKPVKEGGGGDSHKFEWLAVREFLHAHKGYSNLPERFPG